MKLIVQGVDVGKWMKMVSWFGEDRNGRRDEIERVKKEDRFFYSKSLREEQRLNQCSRPIMREAG